MQWLIDIAIEAMKAWLADYYGYHDRGQYAGCDFIIGDFIVDSDWHTLDLSAIVPEHAKAVTLGIKGKSNAVGLHLRLRPTGTTGTSCKCVQRIVVAGVSINNNPTIGVDADRKIDYYIVNNPGVDLNITVRGWWLRPNGF